MIYDDYIAYTREYRVMYPRALVLIEVGTFFELYNCDKDLGAPIEAVCDLCNMQYTRKDKKLPLSSKNPMMAGFPSISLRKYLPLLVADGYTIVLVSQVSPSPNPRRQVTDVISSSTYVDGDVSINTSDPCLVSLFFETVQDWQTRKPMMMIGIAALELSTGVSHVAQCASSPGDYTCAYDELYRLLTGLTPAEVIIHSSDNMELSELVSNLELDCIVHDRCGPNKFDKTLIAVKFQNDTCKRVFMCNTMLSPVEELDLELIPVAACALMGAIKFVEHHNSGLLKHIKRPTTFTDSAKHSTCELCFNTSKQLHVYSKDPKDKTLEKLLNRCVTAMGKRYFTRRLLYPFANSRDIDTSLECIDAHLRDPTRLQNIRTLLRRVCDLERLFHKIELGKCPTPSILMMYDSLCTLQELGVKSTLHDFMIHTFEGEFFRQGVFDDVDELRRRVATDRDMLQGFVDTLNKHTGDGFFKLDYSDRDGHYIIGTAKRWKDADLTNAKYLGLDLSSLKAMPVSSGSTSIKLTHSKLKEVSNNWTEAHEQLVQVCKDRWAALQSKMAIEFKDEFGCLVTEISKLDFYSTCALIAKEFGYCRPRMGDGASYVKCNGLRHAVMERIHDQVKYVENDVHVGAGTNHTGFLLYGLNSAGKSSLMKALGLCVIMAQSGMYVPCNDYESAPYTRIFTRITRGDDMLKGQSTFTVEMSELRNILKRSDDKSLVVGDELCAGTESISGASIVTAGVLHLLDKGASFVLTTHLHSLMELDVLRNQSRLGVYHIAVRYDDTTRTLVYDRKLADGSGSSLYGLEVCRSLDMDNVFMARADEIRLSLQNKSVIKTSRYNAHVVVDRCSVCDRYAEEVHHIVPQASADSSGMIGVFHKNATHNLVCLCSSCHDQVHAGKLQIDGYQHTSKGVELRVAKNPPHRISREVEEVVRKKRVEGLSFANIQRHIHATMGVNYTTYMIKKMATQSV